MGWSQCLSCLCLRNSQVQDEHSRTPTVFARMPLQPSSSEIQASSELQSTKSLSETLLSKASLLRRTGSFKTWAVATGARAFSESLAFAAMTATLKSKRSPEANHLSDRQLQSYNNVSHLLPPDFHDRLPGIVVVGVQNSGKSSVLQALTRKCKGQAYRMPFHSSL